MIDVYDNVFSEDENTKLLEFVIQGNYQYGELDHPNQKPCGLSMEIHNDEIIDLLSTTCIKHDNRLSKHCIQRAYVNIFMPNEQPNYHVDGDVYTCLFYIMPEYMVLSPEYGGETMFYLGETLCDVRGVSAKSKRLVIFDGNLLHKATSFTHDARFTIAAKFNKEEVK